MTLPKNFRKSSGCSRSASVELRKMTPCLATMSLTFEYAASLSNCASTPARNLRSCSGMPSRSNVRLMSSGTSSHVRLGFWPCAR